MSRRDGGVLLLGRAVHPPWNEGTRLIAREVAIAAGSRRRVHAISLTEPGFLDEHDDLLPVEHVRSRGGGRLSEYAGLPGLVRRAWAAAEREGLRVAHLVGVPLAVAPLLRRRGMRVVVHVTLTQHAYQGRIDRLRASAAGSVYGRSVDAWACAADPIRDDLLAAGRPSRRLFVVPPGIDLDLFARRERAAARAAMGLDPDAFTLLYLGTVSPLRFPADQIAQALRAAAPDAARLSLVVVAPVRTHAYNVEWMRENVEQGLADAGVPVTVRLADLAQEQKPDAYSAADAVLVPFAAPVAVEPPLTLLEAMACGAVVIAAPHANRSAVVEHGRNGLTFDGGQELADRIRTVAAMGDDGRAAIGAAARASIERRFSAAATLEALNNLWEEIGV